MTTDRRKQAEELFQIAVDRTAVDRTALLRERCGDDAALRDEVEQLLRTYDAETGVFLEQPAVRRHAEPGEKPGDQIGPYKLLSLLGEGGMGVVYLAEQVEPIRRTVALKLIKLGMDTKEVIARFESERQALAMMSHPNVATVLDVGATSEGRPYFVMEYVPGVPITEYCDRNRLPLRARLELFIEVCQAVQHAHQKGIIHRDLKPSNVLVTIDEKKVIPKVIDFGVAKAADRSLTDKTPITAFGQLVGTPEYMSPEQAEMTGNEIDTRADVYSLGVLLYELLVGTTPFDSESLKKAGLNEMVRIIREDEPERPSTKLSQLGKTAVLAADQRRTDARKLGLILRGDLDWIAMRCLEKDQSRRYGTAAGLADDIRRHLQHEPVVAGPPSTTYRLRKFVRRNRPAVFAASLMLTVLILGVIGTSVGLHSALREREKAEFELARASEIKQVIADMLSSTQPFAAQGFDTTLMRLILDRTATRVDGDEISDPLVEAELRVLLSRVYGNLDEKPRALKMAERAYEIRRAVLGDEDPSTLEAASAYAGTLSDVDEAERLYRQTLATRRRLLGDDHRDTLISIENLSLHLSSLQRCEEAEALLREALDGHRRIHGDLDPGTLKVTHHLAGLLLTSGGRLAEAEAMARTASAGYRRVFENNRFETIASLSVLGQILEDQGRLDEAEALLRECREIVLANTDTGHPLRVLATSNLGHLLARRGDTAQALRMVESALDDFINVRGTDHLLVCQTWISLASYHRMQGNLPAGESVLRNTMTVAQRILPENDWFRLYCAAQFARSRYERGHTEEALEQYAVLWALARHQASLHPELLHVAADYGAILSREGRLEEAESLERIALDGLIQLLGPDYHGLALVQLNFGVLLVKQGRPEEAEGHLRDAAARFGRDFGDEYATTLFADLAVARALSLQDEHTEAALISERVLEVRRRVLGPDHESTQEAQAALVGTLIRQGHHDEAEPLLRELAEDWLRRDLAPPAQSFGYMATMVQYLLAQERFDAVEPFARLLLRTSRVLGGNQSPATIGCVMQMGLVFQHQGRLAMSESLLTEALASARLTLADAAKTTSMAALGQLWLAYDDAEHAEQCIELMRECAALRKSIIGEDPTTMWRLHSVKAMLGTALLIKARSLATTEPDRAGALLVEAEAMLIPSAEALLDDPNVPNTTQLGGYHHRRSPARRAVELYELRHLLEPVPGHEETARVWRERLKAIPSASGAHP